jgi:PBSX family phage terminase large subunit
LQLDTTVFNEQGKLVTTATLKWGELYYQNEADHKAGVLSKWFKPHRSQQEILDSRARFLAAIGGINGGKSSLGALWMLKEIAKNPSGQFLVVAPTFKIVKSGTLEAWLKVVNGTEFAGQYTGGQEPVYVCGNGGARVYFRSLDNPRSCEGLKPLAVWADEAGLLSLSAYEAVKGRLAGTGGPLLCTTTPYVEHNWLRTEIAAKADRGDKDYFYRSWPSIDNPEQDREVIEEERRSLPDWKFRLKYLGEWTRPAGVVYPDLERCVVDPAEVPWSSAQAYFGSADWGGSDPNASLTGFVDSSNNLFVFHEVYVTNRKEDVLKTIERLVQFNETFKAKTKKEITRYWCDHRPDIIRALRRKGLNAKPAHKGARSIELGIAYVDQRIRNTLNHLETGEPLKDGLMIVKGMCPNLIREGNLYRYPTTEGEVYGSIPIDKDNHALDCLRYLCLALDRKKRSAA